MTRWRQTALTYRQTTRTLELTKNWPALKLELANPPVTIPEAIERLLLVLSNEDKLAIASMDESDLYDLHFITIG